MTITHNLLLYQQCILPSQRQRPVPSLCRWSLRSPRLPGRRFLARAGLGGGSCSPLCVGARVLLPHRSPSWVTGPQCQVIAPRRLFALSLQLSSRSRHFLSLQNPFPNPVP